MVKCLKVLFYVGDGSQSVLQCVRNQLDFIVMLDLFEKINIVKLLCINSAERPAFRRSWSP